MEHPLVSIIIPYYNGDRFIAETLDSVFAQKYPNLEVIVVDDGSRPETLAVLDPYLGRITLIHQDNAGQAAARNTGLRAARGTIIGLLDHDDLWPADHLALMMPYLQSDTCDVVRGTTVCFELLPDGTRASSEAEVLPVLVGSMLYTRAIVDQVGMFDADLHEGEDVDWIIRMTIEHKARLKEIPNLALLHRKHDNNYSIIQPRFAARGTFNSIRKKLDRARGGQDV